jgi:threonine/homoserine/homoserine lactone efflux protein
MRSPAIEKGRIGNSGDDRALPACRSWPLFSDPRACNGPRGPARKLATAIIGVMPAGSTLLLFCTATFVLVVTPGPGVMYLVGRSVDQGRSAGVASMLGIEAAELVYVMAAGVGVSAVLAASATALDAVRLVGAAYLIVLGVRRWRAANAAAGEADGVAPASPGRRRVFAQGFVVQLLNPKVAVFFVAYFPQFLNRDAAALPQTILLGAIYIAIAVSCDITWVLVASRIAARLRRSAAARARLTRASGLTYIALGALAAVSGHRATG